MNSLSKLIIILSLQVLLASGCNNNGGLMRMFSGDTDTKPDAAAVDTKDVPQPQLEPVMGANPTEPAQAAPESIESKLATVNSRIAATKVLRKKYCPAIVNEAMYNHGSLIEMEKMYEKLAKQHPELKTISKEQRRTTLKKIFSEMRLDYYISIDKKLGFFCGNADALCDDDSNPCHRIADHLKDRGRTGQGEESYKLYFNYYNEIQEYQTLYELMEIVVLDWIDDDINKFSSGRTHLDFLKKTFAIDVSADPNQPVHVDWKKYGYDDIPISQTDTPSANNQNSDNWGFRDGKIDLDKWTLPPDALGNEDESTIYQMFYAMLAGKTIAEVKKEQGKNTGQFFSIKKCLKPCLKFPDTCYDDMDDYYHESVYKLIRATTALAVILSTFDKINNKHTGYVALGFASTIWMSAAQGYFGNLNDPNTRTLFSASPVGKEILDSRLDDKSKLRILGIWYLRQVHYAVEAIFNETDIAKIYSYNEYVKKIEDNPLLWNLLSNITYSSKPANIDWTKYKQNK